MTTGLLQGTNTQLTARQQAEELANADRSNSTNTAQIVRDSNTRHVTESSVTQSSQNASSLTLNKGFGAGQELVDAAGNVVNQANVLARTREFQITYKDVQGNAHTYSFSLLPAIETNIRASGYGATVPEVKPGIKTETTMNYKRIAIPGGPSIFQSLGIQQTALEMVGLFIGAESIGTPGNPNSLLYGQSANLTAHKAALAFDQDVVQSGQPVDVLIRADGNQPDQLVELRFRCLIQGFKVHFTRSDRAYYCISAVLANYKQFALPTADPGEEAESRADRAESSAASSATARGATEASTGDASTESRDRRIRLSKQRQASATTSTTSTGGN